MLYTKREALLKNLVCFMIEKKQKMPIISVLLPVHNAEPYLILALDSLLEQTFPDFEVIAINDGSTDSSGQILNQYALKDSRIRVFHRQQRGLVLTLNEGIDLARGQWIARMDADDVALPRRFELQLIQLNLTDADFCGGAVVCFGESRTIYSYPQSNEGCGVQLLFGVPVAHPTVIGRRSAFISLRYDPKFKHAEDYDLWQRAWELGYKFTNVSDLILRYRVHKKQVSKSFSLEQSTAAESVRIRQWKHLCTDLNQELNFGIFLMSPNDEGEIFLIKQLHKMLPCIPEDAKLIYLNGVLRILMRRAVGNSNILREWILLFNSMKIKYLNIKWRGILILLLLSAFKLRSGSILFDRLRVIKNKI